MNIKRFLLFALASAAITFYFFDFMSALGVFLTIAWGRLNFLMIQELTLKLFSSNKNPLEILVLFIVKFPLLYITAYLLVMFFSPWVFLGGFTLSLAIFVCQGAFKKNPIVLNQPLD